MMVLAGWFDRPKLGETIEKSLPCRLWGIGVGEFARTRCQALTLVVRTAAHAYPRQLHFRRHVGDVWVGPHKAFRERILTRLDFGWGERQPLLWFEKVHATGIGGCQYRDFQQDCLGNVAAEAFGSVRRNQAVT
jgi:hypothetical protein